MSLLSLVLPSLGSILWHSALLRLLLHLDTYGCVGHLSVILLFLIVVADVIAPKLSIIFRTLIIL